MKPGKLTDWATKAYQGQRRIYGYDSETRRPSSELLKEAWGLYEAGLVLLFHQRMDDGRMAYVAQRTGTTANPPAKSASANSGRRCSDCGALISEDSRIGMCRRCGVNAARRRRREGADA